MFPSTWLLVCLVASGLGTQQAASPAQAPGSREVPPAAAAAPAQAPTDDERQLVLAEPEFAVVNLPTTLRLPKWGSSFRLTHRFLDNLRVGGFGDHLDDVFGLDNGAVIALEYRIAPIRRTQFVFFRNNVDKTIELSGRYDFVRQGDKFPVSGSAIVSVEGTRNFRAGHSENSDEHQHGDNGGQRSPAVGAVFSRVFGTKLAVYATPMWVHNTRPAGSDQQDTTYIGLATRARIRSKVYLVAEMSPRLSGYAPSTMEYGFGIERRAGGHMFQLTFTNATAGTYGQLARGGFPNTLYLGFNLARKFF
jgi:hypothetical protein